MQPRPSYGRPAAGGRPATAWWRGLRARDVLEGCIEHMQVLEDNFRAWVATRTDRARAEADALDRLAQEGHPTGPLHGLVVGVKDLYDVAGLPTRAGSALVQEHAAAQDAELVHALRRAGAVLLGKTVTTEWAASDAAVTRNPWNRDRTPGGSSTGSAVAVASGMCVLGLGSQTAGSLVRPAAYNGVVAMLPTAGRLPTAGMVPSAWSLDTPGFLATEVEAVAAAHAAATRGTVSLATDEDAPPPRLGLVTALAARATLDGKEALERAAATWERDGARVEPVALPGDLERVLDAHWTLLRAETAAYHQQRFSAHAEQYGPGIRAVVEAGLDLPATAYVEAMRLRTLFRSQAARLARRYDALLCPAAEGGAPPRDPRADHPLQTGDPAMQMPWTFAGLPVLALPLELGAEGLPLGAQLVGAPDTDSNVLAVGRWCERRLGSLPYGRITRLP